MAPHNVWHGGVTALQGGYADVPTAQYGVGLDAADVAAGLIPEDLTGYRTPEMDWANLMRNVGRTWQERVPLQGLEGQLRSRYQLGQTGDQSFGQFLGGSLRPRTAAGVPIGGHIWTGATPDVLGDYDKLREQALYAAQIAGHTPSQSAQFMAELGGPESAAGQRLTSLRGYFDPVQSGAVGRQRDVANLLAQQRTGGGQWQGRMAQLVEDAINSMATERAAQGYDQGTFLDWYLNLTAPPA